MPLVPFYKPALLGRINSARKVRPGDWCIGEAGCHQRAARPPRSIGLCRLQQIGCCSSGCQREVPLTLPLPLVLPRRLEPSQRDFQVRRRRRGQARLPEYSRETSDVRYRGSLDPVVQSCSTFLFKRKCWQLRIIVSMHLQITERLRNLVCLHFHPHRPPLPQPWPLSQSRGLGPQTGKRRVRRSNLPLAPTMSQGELPEMLSANAGDTEEDGICLLKTSHPNGIYTSKRVARARQYPTSIHLRARCGRRTKTSRNLLGCPRVALTLTISQPKLLMN